MLLQNKLCFEPLKHLKGVIRLIGNSLQAELSRLTICFLSQQTSAEEAFEDRNSYISATEYRANTDHAIKPIHSIEETLLPE